jgi:nitrate reductase gamma subunit
MKVLVSLGAVLVLLLVPVFGVDVLGLRWLFGVAIPYLAMAVLLGGVAARLLDWARSPVPFRIPTTCGQQRSLAWIPSSRLDNPATTLGVVGRMALEVLLFRSLFRNTRVVLHDGRLAYGTSKWLWAAALCFHWSFLFVLLRHLRFAFEPVPGFVLALTTVDGFLQVGAPALFMTGALLAGAVTYLLLRRIVSPQVRYVSLPADYFPLLLIGGIALSGLWLRHFAKVDVTEVKALVMSLVRLAPKASTTLGSAFYVHLFFVSALFAYLPFSKLMHAGGVFLSPTRNLANDNRARRHVNPWSRPLPVHSYEEYEDEFREKMRDAGIPLDKE